MDPFSHFFRTGTRGCRARCYVGGLMQSMRKNMERMAEVIPDTNDGKLQHVVSVPPWEALLWWTRLPVKRTL